MDVLGGDLQLHISCVLPIFMPQSMLAGNGGVEIGDTTSQSCTLPISLALSPIRTPKLSVSPLHHNNVPRCVSALPNADSSKVCEASVDTLSTAITTHYRSGFWLFKHGGVEEKDSGVCVCVCVCVQVHTCEPWIIEGDEGWMEPVCFSGRGH